MITARCVGLLLAALLPAQTVPATATGAPTAPTAAAPPPLRLVRTVDLGAIQGRIDHLACSTADGRLFVAALGNGSLEVVDLGRGVVHRSIGGLAQPQGIAFVPDPGRIVVACGGDGMVVAFGADTLREVGRRAVGDDADNVRLAADGDTVLVAYGDGGIARLGAADLALRDRTTFAGHPESFQLLPDGRALVNVPQAQWSSGPTGATPAGAGPALLLLDLERRTTLATWPLTDAAHNFPLALDPRRAEALVGSRVPARLLRLELATGRLRQALPCIGDVDDVFIDAATDLVFAIGGEGAIDVFAATAGGDRAPVARVPTRAGARTGLLVPELRRLFVAVPRRGDANAELREYAIDP